MKSFAPKGLDAENLAMDRSRMKKEHKFDKLDDWIKQEYEHGTQRIEDNLSKDGSFDPDQIDSEALYRRIQMQIHEEKYKKKIDVEKQLPKKRHTRLIRKRASIFIIALASILLAGMTSKANRSYLKHKILYLAQDEVAVESENQKKQNNKLNMESEKELLARQDIQQKLGISIPFFQYKPSKLKEITYNINHKDSTATVIYRFSDTIISLYVDNNDKENQHDKNNPEKTIKRITAMDGLLTIPVQKLKISADKKISFSAEWIYDKKHYLLIANTKEKEFYKIVKSICY